MSATSPVLELGYVSRAHGLRGELAVRTFDPGSDSLEVVERVLVRPKSGPERTLTVESLRATPKEFLVAFSEVETREEAEGLVGAAVFVYREDLPAPEEGEYFQGDLVGLEAFDEAGLRLGTVAEIWNTGEVANLVIRDEGRPELVVPFADEFVPTVSLEERRLTVRPPRYDEDA